MAAPCYCVACTRSRPQHTTKVSPAASYVKHFADILQRENFRR
jgi:hypothetical protein